MTEKLMSLVNTSFNILEPLIILLLVAVGFKALNYLLEKLE